MDNWSVEKEFLQTFRAEAEEHLQNLSQGLMTLEGNPGDQELLKKMFREAHTLKGAAGMMGFNDIKDLAHSAEDIMSAVQNGQVSLNKSVTDLLLETLDLIDEMLPDAETGITPEFDVSELKSRLLNVSTGGSIRTAGPADNASKIDTGGSTDSGETKEQAVSPEESPQAGNIEGDDLKLAEVVTPLPEKQVVLTEPTAEEGAAKHARPKPSRNDHDVDPTIRVNIERLDKLLNLMGEILVNQIDSESQVKELSMLKQEAGDLQGIFNSLKGEMELLKEKASEDKIAALNQMLIEAEGRAGDVAGRIDSAASRMKENTASRRLALDELQDRTLHVRMLPLANIFGIYPRVVRDASSSSNKKVQLETTGEETELDKRILEQIADPLMHIIRNCVDHGIESPADRRKAGKAEQGTVRLAAFQRGDRVEIEIGDDGAGIDPEKIRQAAIRKNLIAENDSLTADQCIDLIFRQGFSTAEQVTDISGRGVGLDVVKNNIEKLEGYVTVDSDLGAGTRFTVSLPVTLAVIKGLLVESNDSKFVIPLASVREMVAVTEDEIQTLGQHRGFLMRENAIPIVDLLEFLGGGHTKKSGNRVSVVVVKTGNFAVGLEVGRLLGEQEVVIKPVGSYLGRLDNVAGVTILGSGEAVVVLNINQLARKVKEGSLGGVVAPVGNEAEKLVESRKKVLVVEDSLVVRELQKNILEAAGYEVDTAVDGEDALTRLAEKGVDCVVTDLEMPRMNGFDLTTAIRSKEDTQDVPVIMVTSCSSEDDKKRGIEAGANAYVVKGSFDQQTLLNTIERLVA